MSDSPASLPAPAEVPLLPQVTVVVHPVDTEVHPLIPPGYRWAIHVGGRPIVDLALCVQAGHEPDRVTAAVAGEMVGAAVTKALRLMGCPAGYGFMRCDYDPLPAEADNHPVGKFE